LNLGRFGSASILAYPNPAVDELTIEVLSKNKQSVTLEIYNATGSLVYSDVINLDEQITVSKHSIRDLNDGIYLLRVSGQGFNDTLKLIKNK
jgi:DNA-directed RNA polymerase subunit L